jgi:hypothetical protein
MWHRCVIDVTIFCGRVLADSVLATSAINLSISARASIRVVRTRGSFGPAFPGNAMVEGLVRAFSKTIRKIPLISCKARENVLAASPAAVVQF